MMMTTNASEMKGSNILPHEGERKDLNSELWHACAGPLVSLPAVGTRVVYFSQGHIEQVAASTQKLIDAQIPAYPNLPPQLVCQLHDIILNQDRVSFFSPDSCPQNRQPNIFFYKTLTASDTSTHGGFSIPRRAAEKVFPPLDFTQQPPTQELTARDLHDMEWKFRHIYRGQPKRHLLTTGWSVFVSAKRLVAGDSVLFIRNDKGQLLLGIRRTARPQTVMPSSILSSDSMHIGVLAAAAYAANTNSRFTVFYNPRTSPSEFVIPLSKFEKAVYHTHISIGMRFRMLFETEESSVRRYMGTITGISDLDPVRWPNSQWRCIKVGWDESTAGDRQRRVSLWEIEPLSTFLMYPPTSNWRLRPSWPDPFGGSFSSDMELESLKKPSMWMQFQNGSMGYNVPATQGIGMSPLLDSLQQASAVESKVYDALGAAALQEILPSKQLLFHPQQQVLPPDYLLYRAQAQQQQQMHYPVLSQYEQLMLQQQQLQQQLLPLQQQPHHLPLAQQQLQQQQQSQELTQQQCLPQPQPQQLHSPQQQQPSNQPRREQLTQHSHHQPLQQLHHQQKPPQEQLLQLTHPQPLAQQPQKEPQQHHHLSHEPMQQQRLTHQSPLHPGQQLPLQQHHQQQLPHQQPATTQEQQQQELPQLPHQQQPTHCNKQQRLLDPLKQQLQVPQVLPSCASQAHHHHHYKRQQQKQNETQLYQQQTQPHTYPPLPQQSISQSQLFASVYSMFPGQQPRINNLLLQQDQGVQTSQLLLAAQKQQQLHSFHAPQQSQPLVLCPEHLHQEQPYPSLPPRGPSSQPQTVPSSLVSPCHCTSTNSSSILSSVTASQHLVQSIFGGFASESYSMNSNVMSTARSLVQPAAISCSTDHHDPLVPASWMAAMSQLVSGVPSELIDDARAARAAENTCNTDPVVLPSFQASGLPSNLCNHRISSHLQSELQMQTLFGVNTDLQSMVLPTTMPLVGAATSDCSSGNDLQGEYMGHYNQGQSPLSEMDLPFGSIIFNGGLDDQHLVQTLAQANSSVRTYTKVYKTGSVGRSVDVTRFSNYDELRSELARLFGLEGQLESPQLGWQLIFVDKENDWLLLGDGPWEVFINNVRCIKILSPSDVFQMQGGMGLLPVQRQTSSSSEGCVTQQDTRNPSSVITSLDY